MSANLIIMTKNEIYTGADTALSVSVNGQSYRCGETNKLSYNKKEKAVLFLSGADELAKEVYEVYKDSDGNIYTLRDIIRRMLPDYLYKFPETEKAFNESTNGVICAVLCKMEKKTPVIYVIDRENNFDVKRIEAPKDGIAVYAAGFKVKEAFNRASEFLEWGLDVRKTFENTFNYLACEQVGGELNVFQINKKFVKNTMKKKIQEPHNLKQLNQSVLADWLANAAIEMDSDYFLDLALKVKESIALENKQEWLLPQKHRIVAETLYGKVVLSQRVVIGDSDGVWLMEGPTTTIRDRHGREAMFLGLIQEEPDKFGMTVNRYATDDEDDETPINKISVEEDGGFTIERWNGYNYDKVFSVDNNGYLYTQDMTTKSLKIIDKDNGLLLDGFTKYMNISKFENIVTDGKLTGIEKLTVLGERTRIMSEYTKLLDQANAYKKTSRDDTIRIDIPPFTSAYNALITYLEPLLSNMTITSDINRDEFIQKFKAYFDAVVQIVQGINDSIKYSSVQLGSYYNNVLIDSVEGITATRNDTVYRTVMNAIKGFAVQRNNGTADKPIWVDLFWADTDGIVHAEDFKINNPSVKGGGIEGSYIILRDGHGGVMKLYPSEGFWAGAENAEDAPALIKPNGEAIFKKGKFIGKDGSILIDAEAGYIDMDKLDIINVGKLVAEMLEVNTILADDGYVNNLTVNRLKTIGKDVEVGQYIDYIDIQDNFIKFITARVSTKTQAKDSRDRLLYWQDGEKRILTTENTGIIAYEYGFNKGDIKEKRVLTFEESGDAATPAEYIGTGDNTGNGRVVNRKRNGGYKSEYKSSNYGFERSIDMNDDGISVRSDKGKFTAISKEFEFLAQEGSLKMGLSNGSVFEMTPTGTKLNVQGDLDIKATGTVTINGQTIKLN
ncbi:hypothetical protein NST45_18395 [Paenibacillus sp. FSL R7-0163]|uniref:hypothetical protein n=1 Tax=Paenibacillus sp. FSL R7-0163 TaxID=2954530 RepID=UPI0030DD8EC3